MKLTDEQIEELRRLADAYKRLGPLHKGSDADVIATAIPALIADLEEAKAKLADAEKDVERLNALDREVEAYGFQDIHEGNRWCIEGPFATVRAAIDAMIEDNAKQGVTDETHGRRYRMHEVLRRDHICVESRLMGREGDS